MRILMPVGDSNLEGDLDESLGRCQYFLLYDTETEEEQYIDNGARTSQGGAGVLAGQLIVDSGCEALITKRCGLKAGQVLDGAGLAVYEAGDLTIRGNIEAFKRGDLEILKERSPSRKLGED